MCVYVRVWIQETRASKPSFERNGVQDVNVFNQLNVILDNDKNNVQDFTSQETKVVNNLL